MKKYFTIEINNEIYADLDGNNFRFKTYKDAENFIKENELVGAIITPQY